MRQIKKTVPVCALLLLAGTAYATRVQRLSLAEMRDQASSIVVALVAFEETRLGSEKKMVWTDYQLTVEEVLLGVEQPATRTLSFAGGEAAGTDIGILGVPRLEPGNRYVLFLLPDGTPWASPTVGWGQGVFEIVPGRSSQEPQVLVSYDGEPLEIDATGIRRGTPVRRTEEWIDLPETPESLLPPREPEPVVLNADGKPIEQPPRIADREAAALDQRPFATLDQLRSFLLGEIRESTEDPN